VEEKMPNISIVRGMLLAIAVAYFALASMAAAQVTSGAAITTTNVNMRVGPSTNYQVIAVLRSGDEVSVSRCSSGWCLVDFGRDRGWVSQTFLRPLISSPGGGGNRPGGPDSGGWGRACFFEDLEFRGRSFCLRKGESDASLGRWENRISSIWVEGRATAVEVCTDRNFRNCSTFHRNVPVLNFMLQQNVSSVRVR
jgi:SH3-like domain-containing protein